MQLNLFGFLGFQSEDPSIEPLCNTRLQWCCWAERRDLVFLTVRRLGWFDQWLKKGREPFPARRLSGRKGRLEPFGRDRVPVTSGWTPVLSRTVHPRTSYLSTRYCGIAVLKMSSLKPKTDASRSTTARCTIPDRSNLHRPSRARNYIRGLSRRQIADPNKYAHSTIAPCAS
jgi:hypothetical protein